jgi:hypothetical protein
MSKPILQVTVRQGVVANLDKYDLYSDGFVDCSPVLMFNKTTHLCGLFHFYAGQLDEQSKSLTGMADLVKPTWIDIYKGDKSVNPKPKVEELRQKDGAALAKLFAGHVAGTAKVNNVNNYTGKVYVMLREGKLMIESECMNSVRLRLNKTNTPKDAKLFDDYWNDSDSD